MAKENRFVRVLMESAMSGTSQIWVETQTGVNYLYHAASGYGGGLTPLLDRDGRPVITPIGSIPDLD